MPSKPFISLLTSILVALLLGVAGEYSVNREQERINRDQRDRAVSAAGQYRAALESEINSTLVMANGLVAYIATHATLEEEDVEPMMKALFDQGRYLRSIGLAPDNRLKYIFPVEGNEKAIGLYYPDLPDQWPVVEQVIRERKARLAGPLPLKQGGVGFIYRVPVFLGSTQRYWGMLSTVIDSAMLMAKAGISPDVDGMQIALRGRDGTGATGESFFGDPALFSSDSITAMVNTPGGSWQLALRPLGGWNASDRLVWLRGVVWSLSLLLGGLVFNALRDVEMRRRAEEDVKRSHDQLNEAQRIAKLGSWALDLRSNSFSCSEETYRIFGLALGAPVSFETISSAIHVEDIQGFLDVWHTVLENSSTCEIEHRIVVSDDTYWLRTRAEISRDAAGKAVFASGFVLDITQQKQIELALRESESRSVARYKKTPAIMHSIDAEGSLVSVSDQWLTALGYSHDEVIGRKSADFLTEESRRFAVENVLPDFFDPGLCVDIPYQMLAKDGTFMDVLLSAIAERDAEGNIVRSYAVLTDVTARKRAEEALAESELRFRGAFESAAHGMALTLPDGRFDKVNPALCDMLGYREDELLVTDFQSITHPDDLAADLDYVKALLDGRIGNYQMEKRFLHKNGQIVWIHLSVTLVRKPDGSPVHFVAQIQDITERKHNHQRLEQLLSQQKALLENDLVGTVTVRNRRIVWANPAFEKMLGYEEGELAGIPTRQNYLNDAEYDTFGRAAYAVLSAGKVYRSQIQQIRKDGKNIWVDVNGLMLDAESGESLWGFVDITELKLLERNAAENERRMELALSGADLGMWDCDLTTGNFSHNRRLIAMLGYRPGEVAVNIREFVARLHPDDANTFYERFYAALKGDTAEFAAEYRVRHKDDIWIWIMSRGKVVDRAENGRALRVTGTNLDISERKRSEAALKLREARLTTLIASMQDIVMVYDTGGRIVEYFHPDEARPHGAQRESIIGKTYADIYSHEIASLYDQATAEILMEGGARTFEYSMLVDGKECISHASLSPLMGDSKYPTGFLTVIRDITEERAAQRNIARLAQHNALLLGSVGEGIYGVDLDYRATFANGAAQAMLGYSESELLGQEQHLLFHHHRKDGTVYPDHDCPIYKTIVDGQIRREDDDWFWRKDGRGFPVAMTVTPLTDAGQRVGAVVIFQDITERKANEAKIHELAFYDPLTGLPNRRLLLDRLGLALSASARRESYGAILFLDMDNFKTLNDTQGHEFGDLLLIEVARRLHASVRSEDTVARLGGDEFVVMLEDLSVESDQAARQAEAIGEKIRRALEQSYLLNSYHHQCSSSIGVSLFKGTAHPPGELLKRADQAMYQAKSSGRNAVRLFVAAGEGESSSA